MVKLTRPEKALSLIANAIKKTYGVSSAFTEASNPRNSAYELDPQKVQTISEGVQLKSSFLDMHVDSETVKALSGEYLGIADAGQPFSTEENLQDSEEDTSYSESQPYLCQPLASRISSNSFSCKSHAFL